MNDPGFGIYIHWPYCLHKCPYCDFNSHVLRTFDPKEWLNAYVQALDNYSHYRQGDPLTSIYFGGGTPSTCPPEIIDAILQFISQHWDLKNTEVTLEANPTSVEAQNFRAYADAGVNRVSIGFQAFANDDLKRLGRMHTVEEALKALTLARTYFPRQNFDLIYARQNQSLSDWQSELEQVLALEPRHVSLYQLTIEPNTRFGDMYERGKLSGLPDETLSHDMFVWTRDFMRERGFVHYEVSNFAKPGDQSRHNLIYWNYGDYLGIGPGAHGRLWQNGKRIATLQARAPRSWLADPASFETEQLGNEATAEEYLIMGLRIEKGVCFQRLDQLGWSVPAERLAELVDSRLIIQENQGLRASDEGRLVLNHVIERLLA